MFTVTKKVTPDSFGSVDACFQIYSSVLNKREHQKLSILVCKQDCFIYILKITTALNRKGYFVFSAHKNC